MSAIPATQVQSQPGISQIPRLLAENPIPSVQPEFLHKISAGFPSPASDYIEDGLDLNAYLVQHKAASFFFNVEGESMCGAGIMPGDKVLVDRAVNAVHGHIVVAVIDAEYTLKRLFRWGGRLELRPENPAFKTIVINDDTGLEIWGVVTGVIRKYRV